jgi:hypothetical protein
MLWVSGSGVNDVALLSPQLGGHCGGVTPDAVDSIFRGNGAGRIEVGVFASGHEEARSSGGDLDCRRQ